MLEVGAAWELAKWIVPICYHVDADKIPTASAIRRELEKTGLAVFPEERAAAGGLATDAVRLGIQESTAFVAVVTPTHVRSDNLALEVGAAWVWSTPIYLLLNEVRAGDLPAYLRITPRSRFEPA